MEDDDETQCPFNFRLDRYEHHMVKKDGMWVCTRCGEPESAEVRPLALAGQIRGERRTY